MWFNIAIRMPFDRGKIGMNGTHGSESKWIAAGLWPWTLTFGSFLWSQFYSVASLTRKWNDVDDLIIYLSWKSFVISLDTGTPRSSWNAWSAGTSSKLFLLYAGLQNSSYTCLQNRLVYDECLTYLHGSYVIKWWVRELALNLSKNVD